MRSYLVHSARAAIVALLLALAAGAAVAEEPSPAAITLAKELIALKGSTRMWDSVVPGVIEQAKGVYLQTNPALSRELNEVAGKLRSEYASRGMQLTEQLSELYAQTFSVQELREALAFYKSPLGHKIVTQEPKLLDEAVGRIKEWTNKFSSEVMIRMRAEMKKMGYDL